MRTKIIIITTASLLAVAGALHMKGGKKSCPLKEVMEITHK